MWAPLASTDKPGESWTLLSKLNVRPRGHQNFCIFRYMANSKIIPRIFHIKKQGTSCALALISFIQCHVASIISRRSNFLSLSSTMNDDHSSVHSSESDMTIEEEIPLPVKVQQQVGPIVDTLWESVSQFPLIPHEQRTAWTKAVSSFRSSALPTFKFAFIGRTGR